MQAGAAFLGIPLSGGRSAGMSCRASYK